MRFTQTPLAGVYVMDVEKFEDSRGFFANLFEANEAEKQGIALETVQIKLSYNVKKGTVRGMHMQLPPAAESKLVRCIRGAVHDVIVDLREASPTYRKNFAVELSGENRRALYVPKMFAHGYQTLSDDAEVMYQVDEFYSPKHEMGLRHDDPALAIAWPLPVTDISPKDKAWALIQK